MNSSDPLLQLLASTPLAWLLPYITILVLACSALDAALPQPAPGSLWLIPRKAVSIIAINFGHASNGRQPPLRSILEEMAKQLIARQQAQPSADAASAPAAPPATQAAPVSTPAPAPVPGPGT